MQAALRKSEQQFGFADQQHSRHFLPLPHGAGWPMLYIMRRGGNLTGYPPATSPGENHAVISPTWPTKPTSLKQPNAWSKRHANNATSTLEFQPRHRDGCAG